jgi:hypothetical protein
VVFSAGRVDIWNKVTRAFCMFLTGCPWTEAQVASELIQVSQELDTMFVSHPDFETQLIKRTGAATFTIGPLTAAWFVRTNGAQALPFHKYALPATRMIVDAASGPSYFINAYTDAPHFVAGHVGCRFRYRGLVFWISNVVDSQHAQGYNFDPIASPDWDPEWDEQAFSPVRGWIRSTCFHEGRLGIGGGRDVPNAVWLSSTTSPYDFDLGSGLDSDAIKYLIHADRVVEIACMISYFNLQIYAAHGEFIVPWGSQNALTPANFSVKQQSGYGILSNWAKRFDQAAIFISRVGNSIREFSPNQATFIESYAADSVSFMTDLITDPVDLDVQMEGIGTQQALAYVTNADGTMAVLSRVKKEAIGGWGQWTTQGSFLRCGVIDREAWIVTSRNVAGSQRTFLEILDPSRMLDYSALWSGAASTTIGPFPLHVGATVHVVSGWLYFGEFTVPSSGLIVLPQAVTVAEVGFNFVPYVTPLCQEVQLADGTSFGKPKRVVRTVADFLNTISATVGGRLLNTSEPDSDPGQAPPLKTGQLECWHLGWHRQPVVQITNPLPLPFTLRALMQEMEV